MNLTPPWEKVAERDATAALGGATVDGATGSGGVSGGRDAIPAVEASGEVGTSGDVDMPLTVFDGPAGGGTSGSIDLPLVEAGAGSLGGTGGIAGTGGMGGSTVDAAIDVPMAGAGGTYRDGPPHADGRGAGGSGMGGKGTGGRSGTGGRGTGGSGAGGRGTGGSGTGGRGTGGSGTGGSTGVVMAGLVAYYACDQTTGPTLADSSGNSRNATLVTGTGGSLGYNFGAGKVKSALFLVKDGQGHATIPQGVLNGATAVTIATWVYLNSSVTWQRVWDFGFDTNRYLFLSPKSLDGVLRFGVSLNGYSSEQNLDWNAELPIHQWKHVAVVIGGAGGVLYVDGQQVATNAAVSLPAELSNTPKNYIGRSQFSEAPYLDPYLDGNIDDFRVYDRALSAAEIQTLFAYTGL